MKRMDLPKTYLSTEQIYMDMDDLHGREMEDEMVHMHLMELIAIFQ